MRLSKLFLLVLAAGFFIASSGGRNDNRAGAIGDLGTCASCHGGAATSNGSIELLGLPSEFTPNTTYDFQIRVNEPDAGATLSASGFQLVATNGNNNLMRGSFTVVDGGTRINSTSRLVQNSPRPFTSNAATWDVRYTTPNDPAQFSDVVFYYAGNSVNENGSAAGDVVYFNSNLIVLPVEWINVSASNSREGNYISWSTASEVNNSHFEIERSIDGKSFSKVGEIEGRGMSAGIADYEFLDEIEFQGMIYYRVKQVDLNGSYEFSKVLIVEAAEDLTVQVYPTQVISDFKVISAEDLIVTVYDATGNQVISATDATIIDMSNQMAGIYYVQINTDNGIFVETKKIVKI